MLTAVALVHLGEDTHHVPHRSDLGRASDWAAAGSGGAVGDLLDVGQ
ncbi:hypothetical protein [Streptomyces sp. NPDC048196]